jgi:surface-anchored protein
MRVMIRAMAVVAALASGTAHAALVENPVRLDRVHVDLSVPYVNGSWDLHVRADLESGAQNFRPHEVLLIAGPDAMVTRPDDARFDLVGVAAGEQFWVMSQNGDIGLYLGFEASHNFARTATMNLSHVQAWDTDGPSGFNPAQKVVEISLIDVRGPGEFSMWVADFDDIRFHMSTVDGIDQPDTVALEDGDDEYWQFVGGHSHVNWGFTAPGLYEIDLQARTFLANGTETRSDVTTFYFSVVPEPASLGLVILGGVGLLARRRVRCL